MRLVLAALLSGLAALAAGEAATRLRPNRRFAGAVAVAIVIEAGIVLLSDEWLVPGALVLAIAWGACAGLLQAQRPEDRFSLTVTRLAPSLALLLVFVTLAIAALLMKIRPRLGPSEPANASAGGPAIERKPVYDGVILWPDVPPQKVVAPPPHALDQQRPQPRADEPLAIPFYGVYWFYRAPHFRPPPDSVEEHGTPTEHTFRSTDFRPLAMEARQNLGRFLDISCCRGIKIDIRNAEHSVAISTVGLALRDSSTSLPPMFLGRAQVRALALGEAPETLTFRMPSAPYLQQFDELVIHFEAYGARSRRSLNIAIERFILLPRS
jgi:hypothetical protein